MSDFIHNQEPYCSSRFVAVRRLSRAVPVGSVNVGGKNPIVVQSMTTTPTQDVSATVKQSIALAEAGCEIIRITAQNVKTAEALKDIRENFSEAGYASIPLVADIHFLPKAAMEAAKHVEKVRINPGNYVDQKKFKIREYSDYQYEEELEKLHTAFSPIVLRCKEYGRAMRIGTNHGSLSDRIMNRYGDTPLGMCESALEFIRIAESHGFYNIILSMKASNPRVMIQAYRLIVEMMNRESMNYPLHLGVTEAGDGDDARIKSAIGIGSLLCDGLGDTIRVSLTEDPVAEIPVAKDLAMKAHRLWTSAQTTPPPDSINFYSYERRHCRSLILGQSIKIGPLESPTVIQPYPLPIKNESVEDWRAKLAFTQRKLKDAKIEGLFLHPHSEDCFQLEALRSALSNLVSFVVWDTKDISDQEINSLTDSTRAGDIWLCHQDDERYLDLKVSTIPTGAHIALSLKAEITSHIKNLLQKYKSKIAFITVETITNDWHAIGNYRYVINEIKALGFDFPLWIRNKTSLTIEPEKNWFGSQLLESSILSGALLSDGCGDALSIEHVDNIEQSVVLAYNILQGSRARTVKTEYVACPSCGRTLFDLQSTTQMIRKATGHLNGVTIAVMGCIVNGPGEMADADFGYVGGAPGKINLYVGKECVQFHIPSGNAVGALVELIKKHDKWTEPKHELIDV